MNDETPRGKCFAMRGKYDFDVYVRNAGGTMKAVWRHDGARMELSAKSWDKLLLMMQLAVKAIDQVKQKEEVK